MSRSRLLIGLGVIAVSIIGYVSSSEKIDESNALPVVPYSLLDERVDHSQHKNDALTDPNNVISWSEQTRIPTDYSIHYVKKSTELWQVMAILRKQGGKAAVVFLEGDYTLEKTVVIDVPNVMFLSKSADPRDVILRGRGMKPSKEIDNLLYVTASNFILDGLTLRDAGNHLIQITANKDADNPIIRNCIFQDSYQQMLKVSYDENDPLLFSDNGLVENTLFEYTAGIGPQFYIAGIDAHGIRGWKIQNNVFKHIASPEGRISEYAIHIWTNAENNIVEGNIIIDSDRGIGFGMKENHPNIQYSNRGGAIRNNIIYHSDNGDKFADAGIVVEDSPDVLVEGNIIYLQHHYPNSIEYRYPTSQNLLIKGNLTNRRIVSRNGAKAKVVDNRIDLRKAEFFEKLLSRLPIAP